MDDIRVGQLNFLGLILRKDGLENLAITGRIEGKRSRVTWMSSVKEWLPDRVVKQKPSWKLELLPLFYKTIKKSINIAFSNLFEIQKR